MPSMMEDKSLIHVDAQIGICEDLSIKFYVIFELKVIKYEGNWEVVRYTLISKSSEFNNITIETV